jgi:arginine-tRNA-protein transferase
MPQIQLFLSFPHPCSYLPKKEARTLFLDPNAEMSSEFYGQLLDRGYRRSGSMVYRPECDGCMQCLPARVTVDHFRPRRSQRRIWEKWRSVETVIRNTDFRPEHFALYSRYLKTRHPNGGMSDTSEQQYLEFLTSPWNDTLFVEFRMEGRLLAVAVTDRLPQGMSAVYTFFDPDCEKLSPGVFAILWQISEARRLGLDRFYLGYLVPGCRKMAYKAEYRPLEIFNFRKEQWLAFDGLSTATPPAPLRGGAEAD